MFYRIRRAIRLTQSLLTATALLAVGLMLTRDRWMPLVRASYPPLLLLAGLIAASWLWTKVVRKPRSSLSTVSGVARAIFAIDWYAFEKLNEAILTHEGFTVERRGGAQPDGGVDLVARSPDGNAFIVQCKHWQAINLPVYVVRELLGSMTDGGFPAGAIHCLLAPTQPAAALAIRHSIPICAVDNLARRALAAIPARTLEAILSNRTHHCPKCEASMVLKESRRGQFWSCTRFPACSGTIREGARY